MQENPFNKPLTSQWLESTEGREISKSLQITPINPQSDLFWTSWHQDVANYFLDPEVDGYIDFSAQLNVNKGFKKYEKIKNHGSNYTFFGFILWHLIQTLKRPEKEFKAYHFRKIDDKWFIINNPAIVVPVSLPDRSTLREAVICDAYQIKTLPQWMEVYSHAVETARLGKVQTMPPSIFSLSNIVGNLPGIPFDGMALHRFPKAFMGIIFAYFGARYFPGERFFGNTQEKGPLHIPFSIKFPHATLNPMDVQFILQEFLASFND